jgi:hypothetical protein
MSSFGIAPAYDDTVKRTMSGFKIPATDPHGRDTFERSWSSVLANPPSLPIVATWNEFFEGSSIEPSQEYGDKYLKATAQYHDTLAARVPGVADIVTLTHERSSRLHPKYSEMDEPHKWGLKTIGAAGRTFPDRVVALDGLQKRLPNMTGTPSLLVVDGGRDLYNASSLNQSILKQLKTWVDQGVPTLIVGREVMEPMRDLLPDSCRFNADLPVGRSIFSAHPLEDRLEGDDMANDGDVIRLLSTAQGTRLHLVRNQTSFLFGHHCSEAPNAAFVNLKPWGPVNTWETSSVSDAECLQVILTAYFPQLVQRPVTQCRLAPIEFTR